MNKTEAIKQALDFLMTRRMGAELVIDALQEALAKQPTQQEPVAWMQNTTAGLYVIDHYDEWHSVPLYTSPPAQPQQPTDEQWQEIAAITGCLRIEKRGRDAILRVFEEAVHGIKEQP